MATRPAAVNGLLKEVGSDSAGTPALEDSKTTSKSLVVVSTLLVGGASLAVGQNSHATGGQLPKVGVSGSDPKQTESRGGSWTAHTATVCARRQAFRASGI
jgi:hypothetical protein